MRLLESILLIALLCTKSLAQTQNDVKAEPWKYDSNFDEDQPFEFSRMALYAPKGCGLDEMQGFKDWIDNYSAKFPNLAMYSKSGDPYIRFWDKNDEIIDDILLSRHDADEINRLLMDLNVTYKPELTWEIRNEENKLKKAFYASGVKEDL